MATIIFKATELCNSRCAYCDVVHKKPSQIKTMSYETLDLFFTRVNEYLFANPLDSAEIIWHGGEPLILGVDYFIKAYDLQQKRCNKTEHRINHAIQSNLTLFSCNFSNIFKKMGITSIGTSYDPFSDLRGLGVKRDSSEYNKRFMEGIKIVEKEGFNWGLIYVVTKQSLENPLEIFNYFTNFVPKGSIMFNQVLAYNKRLDYVRISAEEYADFLGAIFPVWWGNRALYNGIEPFSSLTNNILNNERKLSCCDSGKCSNSHINVGPDGKISQCGRSYDWDLLDYGNIKDKSFKDIFDDPQRLNLLHRNKILQESDCKGCAYWAICHGGCPLDAWSETKSFMHKTPWCNSKRIFIEKYFYPVVKPDEKRSTVNVSSKLRGQASKTNAIITNNDDEDKIWINPIGGLGDTLMISSILKLVVDADPSRQFNLVNRKKYNHILRGHPAINQIGHPPTGAKFIGTTYWETDEYKNKKMRAFQTLAKMFGLKTPVDEKMFVPWEFEDDKMLLNAIPWEKKNIIICPSSDSPRKEMSLKKWEKFVAKTDKNEIGVVQIGEMDDKYVRGAYNLLGLTSPRQVISLLKHFDAIVTCDNFIMHAAHLCDIPAIVIWGPTDHHIYGYKEQKHIETKPKCEFDNGCIGPGRGHLYPTSCPEGDNQCMNQINVDLLFKSLMGIINLK